MKLSVWTKQRGFAVWQFVYSFLFLPSFSHVVTFHPRSNCRTFITHRELRQIQRRYDTRQKKKKERKKFLWYKIRNWKDYITFAMNTWKEIRFSFKVENDIHYKSAINNSPLIFIRAEWLRRNPYSIILSSTCIK